MCQPGGLPAYHAVAGRRGIGTGRAPSRSDRVRARRSRRPRPRCAARLAMLTILPLAFDSCQCRTARRHKSALAVRLICMVRFQLASHSASVAEIGFSSNTPALLINTSTRPSRRPRAMYQSRSGVAGSLRSPSLLDNASTVVVVGSKLAAAAAPMPRAAPVMRIWVFIRAAFHSADKISTEVIG